MAVCEYCGLEMLEADGCKCSEIEVDGVWMKRIRYGDPGDLAWGYHEFKKDDRCHDCNCKVGEFHHPGCDMEACPKCGGQLIFNCTCDLGRLRYFE